MRPGGGRLDLRFAAPGGAREGDRVGVRAIGIVPDQLLTRALEAEVRVVGGELAADGERDLARLAVVERHRGSGRVGRAFVAGSGLRRGALAGTVAHDHHNLMVLGMDEQSMLTAAAAVLASDGGLAVAEGDEVRAHLALPLAGLMSDRPFEEVERHLGELLAAARDLGCRLRDPFMAMSFLGLEVIPDLKLTDRGLVDVTRMEIVAPLL